MTVFDAYQGEGVISLVELLVVLVPVALYLVLLAGWGQGMVQWCEARWPWVVGLVRELFGGEGLKK